MTIDPKLYKWCAVPTFTMKLFSREQSKKEIKLNRALEGILFAPDLDLRYDFEQGKECDKSSPGYLLPVDFFNEQLHGYFIINGKLTEAPIGFIRKKNLWQWFYHMGPKYNIFEVKPQKENFIYLPLTRLSYATSIGKRDEKGVFVSNEGSPFSILGIHGIDKFHPLIIVNETEKGMHCQGLYLNKEGNIDSYNHSRGDLARKARTLFKGMKEKQPSIRGVISKHQKNMAVEGVENKGIPQQTIEKKVKEYFDWENPQAIVRYLDQFVVGQEEAKKVVAVAFSTYMTRVRTRDENLPKENMLLIGPSGAGKSYMISLLAKKANLPMIQTKLSGKSSEGYKGENLSEIFQQMRAQTGEKAPYGIIFLDEIDKLASDPESQRAFGQRLQDELIGWLEEAVITTNSDSNDTNKKTLNTRNILFASAGAFQGSYSLENIIQERLDKEHCKEQRIGFQAPEEAKIEEASLFRVRPEDLMKYGFKPELVGRLSSIAVLNPLTTEDKIKIISKETKDSPLTKYCNLLTAKGFKVKIKKPVLKVIAELCPEETGARALSAICNNLFTKILFNPQKYADDQNVISITPALAGELIDLYK